MVTLSRPFSKETQVGDPAACRAAEGFASGAQHHQGREGVNAPTRHAMANAAMTAIPATTNTATRQISDRSAIWEGSLGSGVGILSQRANSARDYCGRRVIARVTMDCAGMIAALAVVSATSDRRSAAPEVRYAVETAAAKPTGAIPTTCWIVSVFAEPELVGQPFRLGLARAWHHGPLRGEPWPAHWPDGSI
jgi:hypothetical protein